MPQSGGSSVIVENLAKNFSKDEIIILGSATWNQKNIPSRDPNGPIFNYFFSELYFMGRGYRYFTWFRRWRFKPLIKEIKRLIIKEKIDHVIGVYPNPFYCLAASRAANSLNISFSSYFHNTYIENTAITDSKAERYQAEIFTNSKNIFVMSKGMQQFYEEKYQLDKFVPLVHTFNKFPDELKIDKLKEVKKDKFNLVAIGNFNESNLEATKRFLGAIANNPKYTLSIYTHVPKILLAKRGLDTSLFEHKGAVLPEEIHSVIQNYDICILTHGFTGGYGEIEYKTIFPTRTIPLLLSGKPIFAHSPKGSFLNNFIQENLCAELIEDQDQKKVIEGLDKVADNIAYQKELVNNSKKAANQFYGPIVTKELLTKLETTLS